MNDMLEVTPRYSPIPAEHKQAIKTIIGAARDTELNDASWFVRECARNGIARSPSSLHFLVRDIAVNTPDAERVKVLLNGLKTLSRTNGATPRVVHQTPIDPNETIDLIEAAKILGLQSSRGALGRLTKAKIAVYRTPTTGNRNVYRRSDVERVARRGRHVEPAQKVAPAPVPVLKPRETATGNERIVAWIADGLRDGLLPPAQAAELLRTVKL